MVLPEGEHRNRAPLPRDLERRERLGDLVAGDDGRIFAALRASRSNSRTGASDDRASRGRRTCRRASASGTSAAADRRCRWSDRHADASSARRRDARRAPTATARACRARCRRAPWSLPRRTSSEQRRRRFFGFVGIAGAPIAGAVRAAQARHARRRSAAEDRGDERGHEARFALVKRRKKLSVVACAERVEADAFQLREHLGGEHDERGLVALAALALRREIRRIGLDQQPVERHVLRWSRAARRPS